MKIPLKTYYLRNTFPKYHNINGIQSSKNMLFTECNPKKNIIITELDHVTKRMWRMHLFKLL